MIVQLKLHSSIVCSVICNMRGEPTQISNHNQMRNASLKITKCPRVASDCYKTTELTAPRSFAKSFSSSCLIISKKSKCLEIKIRKTSSSCGEHSQNQSMVQHNQYNTPGGIFRAERILLLSYKLSTVSNQNSIEF